MGNSFILTKQKTENVSEIGAVFTLQDCGRESYFSNGVHAGERVYCNVSVTYKDQPLHLDNISGSLFLGIYQANITAVNPWAIAENGLPAGGCRVAIRVSPAVTLLAKYNWTPVKIVDEVPLEIPQTTTGLSWVHYAAACIKMGYNLDSLKGQTVQLQKIQLSETGGNSSKHLFAHIIIVDEKAVAGWLSAPVAEPGIGALNIAKENIANW